MRDDMMRDTFGELYLLRERDERIKASNQRIDMGRVGSESYVGFAVGIYAIESALKRTQKMKKWQLLECYSGVPRFALIDMRIRIIHKIADDTREEYRIFLSGIGSSGSENQSSFFHGIWTREISVYREISDSFVDRTHYYFTREGKCLPRAMHMIRWMTFLKSLYFLYGLLVIIGRVIRAIEQYIDLKNIGIQRCAVLVFLSESTFPESMINTLPFFVGGKIDGEHAISVHGRNFVRECSQFERVLGGAYLVDIHFLF